MLTDKKQILALAPDAETAKRAQGFARSTQWIALEGNEKILWGTAKTLKRNYKTWVSLPEPKFKCSCKGRMPCRHALGLLIVYMFQSENFRVTYDIPEELNLWLKGETKAPTAAEIAQKNAKNEQIRLKNKDKRFEMMTTGVADLEIWLQDIVRQGLASVEGQPPEFWTSISSRMVDAKLGSIGRRIRMMQYLVEEEEDWHEHLLMQLGELYLIVKGFKNVENLPRPLQQEMLNIAGVNHKKADLLAQKGLVDNWIIIGQTEGKEESLAFRRTWLLGEKTKTWGLLLDFAWGRQGYEHNWQVGKIFHGEIVFYPSSYPLRVLFKKYESLPKSIQQPPAYPSHTGFLTAYAKAIAQNPWLPNFPACIKEVIPVMESDELFLLDRDQKLLPVQQKDNIGWTLLAISGGQAIRVFGEWSGEVLVPLSAFVEGRLVVL